METWPVLIDTDAGTDDALAIWLVLRAHQDPLHPIRVVGVTCVNGNTSVDNVTTNVARILRAAGEDKNIPIFRGATTPILEPFKHHVEPFHGEDGFGDVEHLFDPIKPVISPENAVSAIVRLSKEFEGKLTLLALGPLTNLALAVRLDSSVSKSLKSIYCMGGNIEGEGNATISAEFNFAIDPEAAFITLSSFNCPITIAPWEVCKREACPWEWRTEVLGKIDSPQTDILNKAEKRILEKYTDIWIPCDQLAAAVLVDPKVALKKKSIHCTVELHGTHTRGLMVLDHYGIRKMPDNVEIITEFDSIYHRNMLLWAMGGPKP